MTVRITLIEERATRRLRIEGRLTRDEVGELEQLVGSDPSAARLELDELRSADAGALVALRRLQEQGFELTGIPQHLAWRISEAE